MTARTRQAALCMDSSIAALPRHIPDAFERMTERAAQTSAMQWLEHNSAAIDAIRAARIAEGGVL